MGDKQVIVRFIIAAAYSPAPATRCESLHGLCSGAAIGLRERLQDMGDADGRRTLGAEHLAKTIRSGHLRSDFILIIGSPSRLVTL
jgi:hypothetical protein